MKYERAQERQVLQKLKDGSITMDFLACEEAKEGGRMISQFRKGMRFGAFHYQRVY